MEAEEIKALLARVKQQLEKLATTTMLPDNGCVVSKTAMQVLNDRLLPVGRYITQRLASTADGIRGAIETEVCRYIAERYWPQDLVRVNALRVMEMYRNAIFLERIRHEQVLAQLEAESRRLWAEEEEEAPRLEGLEDGFVDEREGEMKRLIDEDMWASPAGGEVWRPAPLLGEIMPELEIGDTDDEGDFDMADEVSWSGYARWPWGQPKGG